MLTPIDFVAMASSDDAASIRVDTLVRIGEVLRECFVVERSQTGAGSRQIRGGKIPLGLEVTQPKEGYRATFPIPGTRAVRTRGRARGARHVFVVISRLKFFLMGKKRKM